MVDFNSVLKDARQLSDEDQLLLIDALAMPASGISDAPNDGSLVLHCGDAEWFTQRRSTGQLRIYNFFPSAMATALHLAIVSSNCLKFKD